VLEVVRFAEGWGYALASSLLFRSRGRVSCFECSRVRRGATYALARFFVNLEGVGGKIYGLGGVVSVVSAVT
jgi:hypothetical protein